MHFYKWYKRLSFQPSKLRFTTRSATSRCVWVKFKLKNGRIGKFCKTQCVEESDGKTSEEETGKMLMGV